MPDGTLQPGPEPVSQPADWEALARYVAGESSTDEARQLEARFAAQPADKALLDALAAVTQRMAHLPAADIDVEAALGRVKARRAAGNATPLRLERTVRRADRRTSWRVPYPAIAAAAILAIGAAGLLTLKNGRNQQPVSTQPRMVATGVGVIDSLRLPDGTRVVLGPQSSIKIAEGYGVQRREVDIRGDVYFDVVHDSSKPFTTRALGAIIQDIGTRFAVRTDAAEGVAVTVSEGSVSLRPATSTEKASIILKSGDRGLLLPNGQTASRRARTEDLAWLRGRLVFREAPLAEVIVSLRRWYGIDLRVEDTALASRHLTATFSGEPPERVLEVIRLVLGAKIERRGDTAIVRASKGRGSIPLK
jgi:transmembrane sensor